MINAKLVRRHDNLEAMHDSGRTATVDLAACTHFTTSAQTADYLISKYGFTLSPAEAAEVLGCHPSHVRAMCNSGELPSVKIGERWRIPSTKLAALIDNGFDW